MDQLVDQVRAWCEIDPETGCWLWTRGKQPGGYGRIRLDGKDWNVTRAILLAVTGVMGVYALHSCDTPPCCNPDHLRWGTPAENQADCVERGRRPSGDDHYSRRDPDRVLRGELNGAAKLTSDLVTEMRARYAAGGVTQYDLARQYDVAQMTVCRIIRGEEWNHIECAPLMCAMCGRNRVTRSSEQWCRTCRDAVYMEAAAASRVPGYGPFRTMAAEYGVPLTTVRNWAARGRKMHANT